VRDLDSAPTGNVARVSVAIPCYNYGQFLERCLDSVLSQQGVHVEVLIVDDASTDDSAEVARRLAERDPRVNVVVHEQNHGHLATYNEGFEWATGEFTVLLSADDLLVDGALARATRIFRENPAVGFVYGRPVYFPDDDHIPRVRSGPGRAHIWPGQQWVAQRFRDPVNVISSPEVVIRTSLLQKVGGFRDGLVHAGDLELWIRLATHGDVAYVRGADQALYRRHGASMSRATYSTLLFDLQQRAEVFDCLATDPSVHIDDRDELHLTAKRRIARQSLWLANRAYDRRRTDETPVDDLVSFAQSCYPGYERLPEWRGYLVRRRIGARRMPYLQPLVLSVVIRRIRTWLWWASWRRRGIGL